MIDDPAAEKRPRRRTPAAPRARELEERRTRAKQEASAEYVQRRQVLLRAAAAVFHEKGRRDATLGDIAEQAGTDRATLYYYVRNKDELFAEVIRESVTAIEAAIEAVARSEASPAEKLRQMLVVTMVQYDAHYPYPQIYANEDLSRLDITEPWQEELNSHAQRIFEMHREVVAAGLAEGAFVSELTAGVLTQVVVGVVAWSHRWYHPGGGIGADVAGEAMAKMILRGLTG